MATTTNYWKLGLFVVAAIAGLIAIAVWLGVRHLDRPRLTTYTYFDEPVTGLSVGSVVSFRGMPIGEVTRIRAAGTTGQQDNRFIEVECAIDVEALFQLQLRDPTDFDPANPRIPDDLRARLERSFVTGLASIQTDYYDVALYPPPDYGFVLPFPQLTVHSVRSTSATVEEGVASIVQRMPMLLDRATKLVDTLDHSITDADVPGLARRARALVDRVDDAFARFEQQQLTEQATGALDEARSAVRKFTAFLDDLSDEEGALHELLHAGRGVADDLRDVLATMQLDDTARAVRLAGGELQGLGGDLRDVVPALRELLARTDRLLDLLERDPGALLRGREPPSDPRRR
ncbi:MAG: MCE family protein [Planctomycetes bacterium]|nr:MCE family protein [Planctomycetota bacterium]